MATDRSQRHQRLLASLGASDWSVVLHAIADADKIMSGTLDGDCSGDEIASRLVGLASHPKWEVRRAVANVAAHVSRSAFDSVLAKLALDQNARVRQAAEQAALRRRDSRHASTLGRQHEERINSTLDDIEARFGSKGREAVKRAAEQVANTFARELYHEVIKLLSPIATSSERLRTHLSATHISSDKLAEEAERIGRRVVQLRSVLDAMRAYTAQPVLSFQSEVLRDVIHEAAGLALEVEPENLRRPQLAIDVPPDMVVELARTRFVQALTNIVANAVESYREMEIRKPIEISAEIQNGLVAITVADSGCGMSEDNKRDAVTLFATSKPNGTGFGLPLAIKIVESEHGGRLDVHSLEGRGTIVRVTIPVHRPSNRL